MSNLNVVIQAIISKSESPISGYDIAKIIKDKTGNHHQQIYRELAKIAKRSDVNVELVKQDDKPDKKMYSFVDSSPLFAFESGGKGDYSKTKLAYEILVNDILSGTDNYAGYINAMREAEESFIKNMEL